MVRNTSLKVPLPILILHKLVQIITTFDRTWCSSVYQYLRDTWSSPDGQEYLNLLDLLTVHREVSSCRRVWLVPFTSYVIVSSYAM